MRTLHIQSIASIRLHRSQGKTLSQIHRLTKTSITSIKKYLSPFVRASRRFVKVDRRESRYLTKENKELAQKICRMNIITSAHQLKVRMRLRCSDRTANRLLRYAEIHLYKPITKPTITEISKEKRLEFAKKHLQPTIKISELFFF
jgi:hypothetical protein